MRIKSLSFKNTISGWNVNNLHFDNLTLLVGASGVGKTKILTALQQLASVANGSAYDAIEWAIVFEQDGNEYEWSGQFSKRPEGELSLFEIPKDTVFLKEMLFCNGDIVVERNNSEMRYNDVLTVKLDQTRSAIALLSEEEVLKPVVSAFNKIRVLRNNVGGFILRNNEIDSVNKLDVKSVRRNKGLSPVQMLYMLRVNNLPEFESIKEDFIHIFPFVSDLDVSVRKIFDDISSPYIRIRERGVSTWIAQEEMSSGMIRTLLQITELDMAEDGDVFLMDEFENGLGVNCIDKLADMIINPDKDIQVIVTSHHPYIINSIPMDNWKVVVRNRLDVRVLSAKQIRVGDHSKHDAFMQLINTNAFKSGVL